MGYSGYIKINGETIINEYKSSGDVIMAYAKAMLLRLPTKLKCRNIVKLVEDFRFIDDSVVDYDLGLQSNTDLYSKIYLEKDYADEAVTEFITDLMGKIAKAYPEVSALFTHLARSYREIASGNEIIMKVAKANAGYMVEFSDGYATEIPVKLGNETFDICALYDGCNALSVEFEIVDKDTAEQAMDAFEEVSESVKNSSIEYALMSSLKHFEKIEVYAGY